MSKERAIPLKPWAISLVILLGLLLGCDGTDSMDPELPRNATVRIPVGTNVPGCEITDACFTPATTTIGVAGTVTWHNDDMSAHTVSSGTPQEGVDGTFDSSLILNGATFAHQFEEAGTYPYFCLVHPWQVGSVIVEE